MSEQPQGCPAAYMLDSRVMLDVGVPDTNAYKGWRHKHRTRVQVMFMQWRKTNPRLRRSPVVSINWILLGCFVAPPLACALVVQNNNGRQG